MIEKKECSNEEISKAVQLLGDTIILNNICPATASNAMISIILHISKTNGLDRSGWRKIMDVFVTAYQKEFPEG